ncbi:ABC transporter permease [Slackia heliotrinireducens]|uniref:ABC-type nitrate/sulfonate/bicarbonate transport system, permease component n=1 Tax=Slackia heliotrinireducens (strain ATCC 29202 / DSM 20476 / NCTC 11029 / RHS 1) TaxID=471855 RepID=C7N1J3_SLAHD|nr:ABC transporter permease [Slackia heliotrinireducens]ACV21285.1 ABC-type nitrate/sulfonate/bicarbonate transport system, permease component [Slackia heliotrinireducens DSM 20476]
MRRLLGYLLAIMFILAGWQLTAMALGSAALPEVLPALQNVVMYFDEIAPAFGVSLYRVVIAMVIGTVLAIPLGLVCGRSPRVDAVFAPVLYFLYPLPKVVLLPVFIVLLGLADAPKIALIALTIFFQVLVTVRDATKSVPEDSVLSVRSLGASRLDIYRHVIVPATLPELFTAQRISSGTAVAILFFAESFAGSTGLGYFIADAWALLNYPKMFAGIIAMAVLGVILYEIFDIAERRLTRWRRL